jgi:hypothetical protein
MTDYQLLFVCGAGAAFGVVLAQWRKTLCKLRETEARADNWQYRAGMWERACHAYTLAPKSVRPAIHLTDAEIQSGMDRVKWAANLIRQLPDKHEGRNSWLLNYGTPADRARGNARRAARGAEPV